jgi:hypothetical protein
LSIKASPQKRVSEIHQSDLKHRLLCHLTHGKMVIVRFFYEWPPTTMRMILMFSTKNRMIWYGQNFLKNRLDLVGMGG